MKPKVKNKALKADMATKIEASRALLYSVARYIDSGAKEVSHLAAMAKYFPADVAMEVTVDAVQIFGGYGYITEYIVEKYLRDAKITQIYEGTNQIQRLLLAAHLVRKGGFDQQGSHNLTCHFSKFIAQIKLTT